MAELLFCVFADDESDAGAILMLVSDRALRSIEEKSRSCIAAIRGDSERGWRVELWTSRFDPDSVGECWDSLIASHVSFPRDVWIGTYDAAAIGRVAPVRVVIIEGKMGYLLHAAEFDHFLDLPITSDRP